jgi:hypothetical protein
MWVTPATERIPGGSITVLKDNFVNKFNKIHTIPENSSILLIY